MVGKFQIQVGICRYRNAGRLMKLMAKTGPPRQRGAVGSRSRVIAGNTLKGVHLPERLLLLASKPLVKVCRRDVPTR